MKSITQVGLIIVLITVLGAGIYGTVGLSDTNADRSVTIEVVEQSNGILAIETGPVQTAGNETKIATVRNQGDRPFDIMEVVTGQSIQRYALSPGQSSDIYVDIDCDSILSEEYEIEIFADTNESDGTLRIESMTTVAVSCSSG